MTAARYQAWHGSFPATPLDVDALPDLESIRRTWAETFTMKRRAA